jgi:hypothetical protein
MGVALKQKRRYDPPLNKFYKFYKSYKLKILNQSPSSQDSPNYHSLPDSTSAFPEQDLY